jgi:NADH-quinone oxidoreductase subunit E
MMAEVRQNGEESEMADSHDAFARLANASAKLFAEQAAAMAAMTAFGISVAGQMTGLMLGTLKPSEENASGATSEQKSTSAVQTDGNVVHLRAKAEKATVVELPPKATEVAKVANAEIERKQPAPRVRAAGHDAAKPAPRKAPAKPVIAKAEPKTEVSRPARKSPVASVSAADDLKRISGIGPRLEKVLNGRGIATYAQIASLSAAALKKIDDDLGLEGRVIRDDWAGQAKALAAGGSDAAR